MKSVLKMNGAVVISNLRIARNFFTRFMGLMLRREISEREGIIFPNCNSIHTFFMRIPIDVVFVSKQGVVLAIVEKLMPWRLLFPHSGANAVLEIGANRAKSIGLQVGKKIEVDGLFDET